MNERYLSPKARRRREIIADVEKRADLSLDEYLALCDIADGRDM